MTDTPRVTKANGHIVQSDWGQNDPTKMDYIHNKPNNLIYTDDTNNEEIIEVDDNGVIMYAVSQDLSESEKAMACQNLGLPVPTIADAGKFVRVSADGKLVIETIENAAEVKF